MQMIRKENRPTLLQFTTTTEIGGIMYDTGKIWFIKTEIKKRD